MYLQELEEKLNVTAVSNGEENPAVTGCYIGDLMSLAMARLEEGNLWITIQTNLNVIAVAALKEAAGVILADGAVPDANALAKAKEEGIFLYTSEQSAYELAKALGELGV